MPIDKIRNPTCKRWAYRAREWAMTIGPGLAAAGVFSVILGLSYLGFFGDYEAAIHPLEGLMPQGVWSAGWLIIGAGLIGVSARPDSRAVTPIYAAWSVLMFVWSASWMMSWATDATDRGVGFASLYALFPVVLAWSAWRGNRTELKVSGDDGQVAAANEALERLEAAHGHSGHGAA